MSSRSTTRAAELFSCFFLFSDALFSSVDRGFLDTVIFIRKDLYIYKRIFIISGGIMVKKEVQDLYKEAIYQSLLRQGLSPNRAEAEARRRMTRDDTL